jgi:hypothetical protein
MQFDGPLISTLYWEDVVPNVPDRFGVVEVSRIASRSHVCGIALFLSDPA